MTIKEIITQLNISYTDEIISFIEQHKLTLANIENLPRFVSGSTLFGQDVYQLVAKINEAYQNYDIPIAEDKKEPAQNEEEDAIMALDDKVLNLLFDAGITSDEQVLELGKDGLLSVEGIGPKTANQIMKLLED